MKKILLSIFTIAAMALTTFGQAPEGFKYQAVVRDAGNAIITNQAVGIQLTIQQGSAGGTAVYTETFAPITNAYGLLNLEIGTGTTTDDFTTIDWSNGTYFIETAIDATGGTNYSVMGTSQLMSVPYALYAKTSGNGIGPQGPQGDTGTTGPIGPAGTDGANGLSAYDLAFAADSTIGLESQWLASLKGDTGLTGPIGPAGADGTDGFSAYDLAFTADSTIGLESQWLASLKGDTGLAGPIGPAGVDGTDGTNGIDGQDGATGPAGANGTNGIDGQDGATGPAGADGQDGATGPAGSDATNFWTQSNSNVYRSSGNVGIETTSPVTGLDVLSSTYSNTTAKFGATSPVYIINNNPIIGFNQYYDSGWKTGTSGYSGSIGVSTSYGNIFFNTSSTSVGANAATSNIQRMIILNNGNVGIGTTNIPTAKLEVNGTARITDLAGSGDRMVVADAEGDLSTQAIGTGPTYTIGLWPVSYTHLTLPTILLV